MGPNIQEELLGRLFGHILTLACTIDIVQLLMIIQGASESRSEP